ncbi:methyltransferase, FxLD system [Streptomyces carpaticus]|uniref:methyltransferase, FxLD system n=1 Tax=Streptomyces carpaticus TaxID=285558 RepID=UPI00220AAA2A|nr:methyltransferase, FxLD system [Streptomyces carpaticus]
MKLKADVVNYFSSTVTDSGFTAHMLASAANLRRVRELVGEINLDAEAVETARLVVSELIANAVTACGDRVPLIVEVGTRGDELRVAVDDPAPTRLPKRGGSPLNDPTAESGRGLLLLDLLANRWDVTPTPIGKRVTAWLPVAGGRAEELTEERKEMSVVSDTSVDQVSGDIQEDVERKKLLDQLIAELVRLEGHLSPEVEAAIRAVPRHLFTPGVPLAQAYAAEDAPIVKKDQHGVTISSVSAVRIQAMMLEQAQIRPGMRVLEIGSGGYNAALIAELVGEGGEVTTIDIDADVTDRARRFLAVAGYPRVHVGTMDGEFGFPDRAPFDRIIVTVGAWDIPPAWVEQLADDGRIVVPLRNRGLTRSVAFERRQNHLVSRDYRLCGFVPMQGVGECRERLVLLHGEDAGLRVDDGQPADAEALGTALTGPKSEAWSGVTVGRGARFDGLHLWLALNLPHFAVLAAQRSAVDLGLVAHAWNLGVPAAFQGGSFAYLTYRQVSGEPNTYEFGAYGHGPAGAELAGQVVRLIQSWDGTHLDARIEVHPAGTPDSELPGGALVLDKRHTRVTISWPQQQARETP